MEGGLLPPGQPEADYSLLGPLLRGFANGGVLGAMKGAGYQPPQWLDAPNAVLQNPEANTAMGLLGMIRAYHGSPHSFNKFDLSKVGSGEGERAYGHGLYFAENPSVAESYKIPKGHVYEASIHADPEHFLDWNKPLSQQSRYVQDAVVPILREHGMHPEDMKHVAGTHILNFLSQKLVNGASSSPAVSSLLKDAGLPGIKYLDGGSRTAGEGTSNYVVFDPATIEILRKYGIAGLLGGGVAAGAAQGQD